MCMEKLNGEKRYIFWDTHSVQMAPKRNLDVALRVKSFKFTPKFLFWVKWVIWIQTAPNLCNLIPHDLFL